MRTSNNSRTKFSDRFNRKIREKNGARRGRARSAVRLAVSTVRLKEAAGRLKELTVRGKASTVWIIRSAVPHGCMGIPRPPVFMTSFITEWRYFKLPGGDFKYYWGGAQYFHGCAWGTRLVCAMEKSKRGQN
jgi:hypothetical protein